MERAECRKAACPYAYAGQRERQNATRGGDADSAEPHDRPDGG